MKKTAKKPRPAKKKTSQASAGKKKPVKKSTAKKASSGKSAKKSPVKKAPAKKAAKASAKKAEQKKPLAKKTADKVLTSGPLTSRRRNASRRTAAARKKAQTLRLPRGRAKFSVKVTKPRHKDIILILDFGSQYTQLIARRIRENKVFCRIVPYNITPEEIKSQNPKGLILSGGPISVYDQNAPLPDEGIFKLNMPILGICYGMQAIVKMHGGKIERSKEREYGRSELFVDRNRDLFANLPTNLTCWMSHSDATKDLPKGFQVLAHTLNAPVAAIGHPRKKIYGVQFHPEVVHTQRGTDILTNFVYQICSCFPRWTMEKFANAAMKNIKERVGSKKVILGLSGGVDSSVAAMLIHKAVGRKLGCIFVDNGLMRKNEVKSVEKTFKGHFKINLTVVHAAKRFLKRLEGVVDPEEKRKIIGDEFIQVFQEASKKYKNVSYLAQGTLYPDVIESISPIGGPSATIKSHHNVGGLPKKMHLELIEPLRELFKDEVREIGKHLGLPDHILKRQPFPGPGLAVRILGEVTPERLEILREADDRVMDEIKKAGFYEQVWQAFAVLLPIKTVGVMGDQRTYDNVIAVRCVSSQDGMTADWVELPPSLLGRISNRIINEVDGVNRVVYDISSKPPSTIEWE
ncbi:MAG: glutamine-hydrolyzing GMP synthase [Candidatus Omnitrophota bacterium]